MREREDWEPYGVENRSKNSLIGIRSDAMQVLVPARHRRAASLSRLTAMTPENAFDFHRPTKPSSR
jgi:hypothetical protein